MINKRALDILVECTDSIKYNALYNQTLKSYSYENARKVLESWNQLHGDPVVCAHKCMAFFEYCIDSEPSTSRIKTLAEILSEGALKKVRDGNQMRAYVKRKISRFKTKLSTKINNKTDDNKNAVNTTIEKFNDRLAMTISCKMSKKANTYSSIEEMEKLISDLGNCNNPYHCPHGRPTIITFSIYELEKMFKRSI